MGSFLVICAILTGKVNLVIIVCFKLHTFIIDSGDDNFLTKTLGFQHISQTVSIGMKKCYQRQTFIRRKYLKHEPMTIMNFNRPQIALKINHIGYTRVNLPLWCMVSQAINASCKNIHMNHLLYIKYSHYQTTKLNHMGPSSPLRVFTSPFALFLFPVLSLSYTGYIVDDYLMEHISSLASLTLKSSFSIALFAGTYMAHVAYSEFCP